MLACCVLGAAYYNVQRTTTSTAVVDPLLRLVHPTRRRLSSHQHGCVLTYLPRRRPGNNIHLLISDTLLFLRGGRAHPLSFTTPRRLQLELTQRQRAQEDPFKAEPEPPGSSEYQATNNPTNKVDLDDPVEIVPGRKCEPGCTLAIDGTEPRLAFRLGAAPPKG